MFTAYIKGLNDMVFSTVSLQVISTLACLCYAERCMAVLKDKYISMNRKPSLIFSSDLQLALLCFVHLDSLYYCHVM